LERRKAIRLRKKDLTALRPVGRYERVAYPTRDEARDLGIDLYRVPDSMLRRCGRKAVVGATFLMLSSTACVEGVRAVPCHDYSFLHEEDARRIVVERLAEEGVTFEMDRQYTSGGVHVNLDGYDPEAGIGFEYYSIEDEEECQDLCCGDEWERLNATWEEQDTLRSLVTNRSADAIYFFDHTGVSSAVSARHSLEFEVEFFVDWLRLHARL
jgi:hypothetical protein